MFWTIVILIVGLFLILLFGALVASGNADRAIEKMERFNKDD
jgi:hypothetical protein